MQEWLLLLLPVAAASGWVAARHHMKKHQQQHYSDVSSDYFKGLNYLLNEEPDKAIEVFVRMAEVDNDTAETHLALGSLFRRRGEVDRAIRIHQNLIARPTLSDDQRAHALYELAEDYMKAGLLDRAEDLYKELLDRNMLITDSLSQLVEIYQQEQDWNDAIQTCQQLDKHTSGNSGELIAQFYCELAEKALQHQNNEVFNDCAESALRYDSHSVRAFLLLAEQAKNRNECQKAIDYYHKAINQDIEFLPVIIESLHECYEKTESKGEMSAYLDHMLKEYDGITPVIYKTEELLVSAGEREALTFIADQLKHKPSVRGLQWLVEHSLIKSEGRAKENLTILLDLMTSLLENKPIYSCHNCGFTGKSMHWQCPGCKKWNTIKPIKGVVAE